LRFGKLNLSTQAGYRLTFSIEVNDVEKVVKWLGDVGRLIEVGTPIGITRRIIAKHEIIRFHYCVFQYQRVLKTERYVSVRVVSLLTLITLYQRSNHEVILKYGDGDISRSCLVFHCSKDNEALGEPQLWQSTTQLLYYKVNVKIKLELKEKCSSRYNESYLHSREMFTAQKVPKTDCIFYEKPLIPQGLIGKAFSERVE